MQRSGQAILALLIALLISDAVASPSRAQIAQGDLAQAAKGTATNSDQMPNFIGLTRSEVSVLAQKYGLEPVFMGATGDDARVTDQSPTAGAPLSQADRRVRLQMKAPTPPVNGVPNHADLLDHLRSTALPNKGPSIKPGLMPEPAPPQAPVQAQRPPPALPLGPAQPLPAPAAPAPQPPAPPPPQAALPPPPAPSLSSQARMGNYEVTYNAPTVIPYNQPTEYQFVINSWAEDAEAFNGLSGPQRRGKIQAGRFVKVVMTGSDRLVDINSKGIAECQEITGQSNPTWNWAVTPKTITPFTLHIDVWDVPSNCQVATPVVHRVRQFSITVTATMWQRIVMVAPSVNATLTALIAIMGALGTALASYKWIFQKADKAK